MLRYLRYLVMERIGTALILGGSFCILVGRGLLQRVDTEIDCDRKREALESARAACA